MTARKHPNDLLVDWALLGARGWQLDPSGAEACDLDPTEQSHCHLDRTTLDILMCGPATWVTERLRDLADAGVPGLEAYRTWTVTLPNSSGTSAMYLTP